ncbi:MAG: hypothetical protein U1A78_27900 [Polyangia bacterium]
MRTLPYSLGLTDLLEESAYTVARLLALPLTASLAKDFDGFRTDCRKALLDELDLIEAVAKARALVHGVDWQLDRMLGAILNTLLTAVHNDKDAALYRRFTGGERPSRLSRPILGEQLTLMAGWVDVLAAQPQPELKALAAPLEKLTKAGQQAEGGYDKSKGALATFQTLGARKTLIDQLNGLRKLTFGRIADLAHNNAAENLPPDFAETFFLREDRSPEPTLQSVEAGITRLTEQLKKQQGLHAELVAAITEQERKRAEADQQLAAEEAAELEKELAATTARLAEVRKRLPPTA